MLDCLMIVTSRLCLIGRQYINIVGIKVFVIIRHHILKKKIIKLKNLRN